MAAQGAPSSAFLGERTLSRTALVPPTALALKDTARVSRVAVPAAPRRLQVDARKRRGLADGYGRQPRSPMPNMDVDPNDKNPKFVLFIKTQNVNIWYPLTMVSGGTAAQMMVAAMRFDLGKKLYEGTLTRNLGSIIYKDEKAIQQTALRQFPMLKGASGFEYGYKLVDPANPKASLSGSGVIKIPPQEALKSVVEKAKDFFSNIGKSPATTD